jgi:23S rRNA pseudouridine1911/1915/1917 synthase
MKWQIHRLQVRPAFTGYRLDQYLAGAEIDISRTMAKKIIDLGGVHLNGRRVRSCSTVIHDADSVEVYLDRLPLEPYRIEQREILFQDKFLIVLNKPALVETQPTHARYKGTLYEALQWHLKDDFRPHQKAEIGMIQRLDRGTSGLIVFSTHQRAHREMTRIFVEHQVEKRYLALVHNAPELHQGEIRSLLARTRKENRVKSVVKGGKEAITRYKILERLGEFSLVDLELLTGRSHQIRAHMAEQGCPLVGDVRYGGQVNVAGLRLQRPMLHAVKLAFSHPVLEHKLEFTAPVPADMKKVETQLRGSEI